MADNHKDDLLILQYLANKALQKTQTALFSFSIRLSHNGLLPRHAVLHVIMARFGLLSAGVRLQVRAIQIDIITMFFPGCGLLRSNFPNSKQRIWRIHSLCYLTKCLIKRPDGLQRI